MPSNTEFFGLEHVATVLGVSIDTVRRLIRSGELNALKLGGTWKVHADEIERLRRRACGASERANTQYATAEAPLAFNAAMGGRRG